MTNENTTMIERKHSNSMLKGLLLAASAALFTATTAAAQTVDADRDRPTPPPVPDTIAVSGVEPFFVGHATGSQNYVCLPSAASPTGVAFNLFTPEATLFNDHERQATTHFFSPNPFENGTVRATWEDSHDTSTVWGKVTGQTSDPAFVKPGAVAWLRVEITGTVPGPTGGNRLGKTVFIQRLNTVGGLAPTNDCLSAADIGHKAFVPYTADYFFFEKDSDGR